MKIIAISDIHLDYELHRKKRWPILEEIAQKEADLLLIGGDIAKTRMVIKEALSVLEKFKGIKLAYLGNHELHSSESIIPNHYVEFNELFGQSGFHLLDFSPRIVGDIGFVGNSGWFDFSLHKGIIPEDVMENSLNRILKKYKINKKDIMQFARFSSEKIENDINQIKPDCKSICLGIHFISFPEFLNYGVSERYDYLNAFMGSTLFQRLYSLPKVNLGFCGHTHRSGKLKYNNCTIYNISSDNNRPYLEIEI